MQAARELELPVPAGWVPQFRVTIASDLMVIMPTKRAVEWRRKLTAARNDITHRKAKDILRASQLALLGEDNKHVAADLRKAASGAALSPILLLRGGVEHPLIVADGYHRVCASYWIDENTDIPCVLV